MLSFAAHNALFLIDDLKHTFYEIIDSATPQKRNSTLNNFAAYVYYIMQIERSFFFAVQNKILCNDAYFPHLFIHLILLSFLMILHSMF